ncbi:hypothetical protein VaNZ11_001184 [Volvox africanus]|uniref:Major facilitator superfamily associated domain-containing protein n=1 Tax=Volvox africanus TaxID=51714 RepID=A0ABQ5RP56_9CHLO|nr:hypothetical protein VaNZ11_001184 [Volvox africanus]
MIRHSSFYRRIAAIWVVVAMTWEGAGELLMQYLQFKLGFNTLDQAHVLTVLASGGLVVKLGLLALMVRWMGERRLLAFGLATYASECVALAAAPTKAAGPAAVSIGSLAAVCWPALKALQTAGVDPTHQGAVFGALQLNGPLAIRGRVPSGDSQRFGGEAHARGGVVPGSCHDYSCHRPYSQPSPTTTSRASASTYAPLRAGWCGPCR